MTEPEAKSKQKRIEIPDGAKMEIAVMNQNLTTYITGVAAGMGIKGEWKFDMQNMCIFVEEE